MSSSSSTPVQLAKVMAPSVIYIDEIEKVFITDKKKTKEFGGSEPFSRIKKELLKEAKQLKPGDQVLIICNSSIPYLAVTKDSKAMLGFIDKFIRLPMPDYGSRQFIFKVRRARSADFRVEDKGVERALAPANSVMPLDNTQASVLSPQL